MTISFMVLVLVLGTGLSSAGFDFYQKLLSREIPPVALVFLLGLFSIPILTLAMIVSGWQPVEPGYWIPAGVSTTLNLIGHITFIRAVSLASLSLTIPLLSLTPAFAAVFAMLLVDEAMVPQSLLGILLVVAGAYWLSRSMIAQGSGGGGDSGANPFYRQPGFWLMLATTVAWSISIPVDKLALEHAGPLFHAWVLTVGITLGALVLLAGSSAALPKRADLLGDRRSFVAALVLCNATLVLQLLAIAITLVSLVETVKRVLGNVLALVFGRIFFRETIRVGQVVAVLVMSIGVGLLLF